MARRLLAILLIVGVGLPGAAATWYLKLSYDLPDMQTEEQIVALVGRSVEAFRAQQAQEGGGKAARFAVVAREALAAPAGRALLVLERCPTYLEQPEVTGSEFWRAQLGAPAGAPDREPAITCAATMATDLAERFLLPSKGHLLVAADKLREVLGRDGLFAVWASALPFEPQGPQGIELASRALFHAAPQELDWERAAELALATRRYADLAGCTNPPQLTERRDAFLGQAARALPASAAEIGAAARLPLRCAAPP